LEQGQQNIFPGRKFNSKLVQLKPPKELNLKFKP
jgi:hypothetical protein